MKHILLVIIAAVLLAGCAGTRHASTYNVRRDSTRVVAHQRDSTIASLMKSDSIYFRDSIFVVQKGDSVVKYVERARYHYKVHTDTLYKYRDHTDTVYVSRRDSIRVVAPVPEEKPRPWWQTALMWLGGMSIAAGIFSVYLIVKK